MTRDNRRVVRDESYADEVDKKLIRKTKKTIVFFLNPSLESLLHSDPVSESI